tara:strand:+ start:66 stop:353 length:288 start_codon:yes stop_codon:yes gene_type:complete
MAMPSIKPVEALADMIGSKARPRTKITSDIWKYIDKKGLKAPSKPGAKKQKVNGRMVYPGQVILAHKDDLFFEFARDKKKISMFDIAALITYWTD